MTGQRVFVVTTHHSDGSGFHLLGVISDEKVTDSIRKVADAIHAGMCVIITEMIVDEIQDHQIFPETPF